MPMKEEAAEFIELFYTEMNYPASEKQSRLTDVLASIETKGTYELTSEELTYGAKVAWRNSNRCIGRLFWDKLHVFDARHVHNVKDVYTSLLDHISFATNKGRIRPTITVFPENVRIWNHQLLRYAGYEQADGSVLGDPHSIRFTKHCLDLGWEPQRTAFDILPLVIQTGASPPTLFPIPEAYILRVPLSHPTYEQVEDLSLEWYAVPIISDMSLEIGGHTYPAAPFNGWYMETEIGARNLADEARYNLLPMMAEIAGFDSSRESTLWRDKALLELNIAVIESFKKHGVTIVDHHTAAKQFKHFEAQEHKACRHVTGDWSWLIPPVSPATTHIFHQSYENKVLSPNYHYQASLYG
ncbi:nitric oxide synthase oxygenase [Aureibacillus halotolerans]|uniref:Nitric oxide synthase oxygenase n=1 Tax=Aureibacillus halotolerans TaxID=1508390 RepID=A0A4R6U8T5_9BACI|nr:nitric oxide synthase oxygenase [Aureibacillus halotolerans]TDQ41055.1 nitric-oxide synthase [Aureibacillus halotolerans]